MEVRFISLPLSPSLAVSFSLACRILIAAFVASFLGTQNPLPLGEPVCVCVCTFIYVCLRLICSRFVLMRSDFVCIGASVCACKCACVCVHT